MPDLLATALVGLAVVVGAMTLLWGVSLLLRDASIVDPFWGPGFFLVTTAYLVVEGGTSLRGWLTWAFVGLWAARLGSHLLRRNRSEGEDPRYASWREEHGASYWWVSLFQVFWLQAGILWVVAFPLLVSVRSTAPLGLWDGLGAALFLTGFLVEALADAQLRRFRRDPANRGRVLDSGLWRYSRHPNYFGDAVLWWGLWLVAVGGGGAWTVFSPVVMTFLLLKVSGVALLEKDIEERRPEYAEYVRRTSAFVPLPPRESDG